MAVKPSDIAAIIQRKLAEQQSKYKEVRVFDHPQNVTRRRYPSIEIVMTQPNAKLEDPRVTNVVQQFIVVLYVRVRGDGSDEVTLQKAIEDDVMTALDGTVLGGNKLFTENKTWTRQPDPIPRPVLHYQSRLNVFVVDIVSTTGQGAVGATMTLTLPGLADMQLLSKPLERETEIMGDILDDTLTRKNVAPISESRIAYYEVELTDARLTTLRSLKSARAKIACTLKRGTVSENFNAKILDLSHGADYRNIETVTIALAVIP
ncbi:MAG: hypothetical protein QXW37_08450 [Candidatus Nitrosotenuis sp.]